MSAKPYIIIIILLLTVQFVYSQSDTIIEIEAIKLDTVVERENAKSSKVALILSAVLPGSGQVYNKKYWKVPIIYAGFGAIAYFTYKKNYEYQIYYDDLSLVKVDSTGKQYIDGITRSRINDVNKLLTGYDKTRRSRDLFIFLGAVLWGLNILDAYVDAELSNFDVSDNLTLNISPNLDYIANRPYYGLSMRFTVSSYNKNKIKQFNN